MDDWAKRRGRSYGTLLIDVERRLPVEMLADREAGTLAAWLKRHVGVEVVTVIAPLHADGVRRARRSTPGGRPLSPREEPARCIERVSPSSRVCVSE